MKEAWLLGQPSSFLFGVIETLIVTVAFIGGEDAGADGGESLPLPFFLLGFPAWVADSSERSRTATWDGRIIIIYPPLAS